MERFLHENHTKYVDVLKAKFDIAKKSITKVSEIVRKLVKEHDEMKYTLKNLVSEAKVLAFSEKSLKGSLEIGG